MLVKCGEIFVRSGFNSRNFVQILGSTFYIVQFLYGIINLNSPKSHITHTLVVHAGFVCTFMTRDKLLKLSVD